jgi:hypothetical protein
MAADRSRKLCAALLLLAIPLLGSGARGQPVSPAVKGYEVEWVYRVRYGFIDEWWDLFRKYQIPILDREKSLGFRDFDGTRHEEEIARTLFRDAATRKHDENRRWELTENHWDLPIYQVDTTKPR